MAVCSINNSEFDVIPVNSELNTISVDSINAFSNILECKIDSKDIILEKVGDVDGQPLVILELNINGNDYVTEAIITDDKDSYIKINENNLHGVVKTEPKKEVIKEEKEEEIISEERLEEMNKINVGNDISAVLAESLTNYNTKKLNEELKNYENIYNTKVQEFEDKKKEILNLVETQFTNNVNILKEDVDKKVDLFFKKTDLNNKTSIAIETDRLKDTINEKYEDFIEELNQKKDLISEDNNEHANKLIKLVEKKEKELKDSVKVFVEKIYTKHQQKLNPQIENIINENKQLNEKIEKLEALKNDLVNNKVYNEDLSKSESNLRKLLKDTNKKFNKINEKFKVLSEKDNKRYNSLLAAINNTDTKEYETVLNNKIEEAELGQIKEELEQRITSNMQSEMTSLKRYVEMSSGGGNVAVQYAQGGTMNGDLTVTGTVEADTILATTLLSASTLDIGFELSGFNVTGNLSAYGDIIGNNLIAHDSLSAAGNLYPTTVATRGQVIVANDDGNLIFGHGEKLHLEIRNDEGSDISAGTPVYSKGEIGGSERIKVGKADASDPTKMPAIGIAETTLNTTDAKDGFAIINGVYNENIPGFADLVVGRNLYVASGGGLTNIKPTGFGNLIQNIGTILKTGAGDTMLQGMKVSSIDRTNDIPNLSAKAIFYGQGDYYVQQSLSAAVLDSTGVTLQDGGITLSQGANRTIKVARATTGEDGNNLTIEGGQFKSGTEGNGGNLTLKGGAGDSGDGSGGDLILEPGAGETAGVLYIKGSSFQLDSTSAKSAFRTAIGAGTGTYSDGSIINTNQVNAYANGTLFINGKTGTTAYPVQITGGSESGDNGDGSDVTIQGGQSGGDSGNGGDVTIEGGAGESTNGKVILGGTNTLQVDVNSSLSMGSNAINATTGGFTSTSGNISTGGTITSTSSTARPVQNNENNTNPIRTIEKLSQSDYNTLVNNGDVDANTLYIIE